MVHRRLQALAAFLEGQFIGGRGIRHIEVEHCGPCRIFLGAVGDHQDRIINQQFGMDDGSIFMLEFSPFLNMEHLFGKVDELGGIVHDKIGREGIVVLGLECFFHDSSDLMIFD